MNTKSTKIAPTEAGSDDFAGGRGSSMRPLHSSRGPQRILQHGGA